MHFSVLYVGNSSLNVARYVCVATCQQEYDKTNH